MVYQYGMSAVFPNISKIANVTDFIHHFKKQKVRRNIVNIDVFAPFLGVMCMMKSATQLHLNGNELIMYESVLRKAAVMDGIL